MGLTEHLQDLGFETGRLKTGTPARVDRSTVDFSVMEPQPGDDPVTWFSFDPAWHVEREQMTCFLTHTNEATHQLIRENLHESPQYGGWVDSVGPRYCPSIEDKVVRFTDKAQHQIFIEPEGRSTPELYIQGFSTGLPEKLQLAMLRTLRGMENCRCAPPLSCLPLPVCLPLCRVLLHEEWPGGGKCRMMRPAYAVEYDYLPAYQCQSSLETKKFSGLFFSGQLNGTTGAPGLLSCPFPLPCCHQPTLAPNSGFL